MIYTPSTDIAPFNRLMAALGVKPPENVHASWVRITNSGVEVSFYYADEKEAAHRYKTQITDKEPNAAAKLVAQTFGVSIEHTYEIVFRFEVDNFATVTFGKEISNQNLAAVTAALENKNEK